MPRLIIQNDQAGVSGKEEIIFPAGTTAIDMLIQELPEGIDPETTSVFVRMHRMTLPTATTYGSPELLEPLSDHVIVTVIHEAKGALLVYAIIAIVVAVATIALMPSIPGAVGQRKESPNNSLSGQTNIARADQAYPLIFGSPISYPDLGGEAVSEYIDNVKIVRQFMCVGVGLFDITAVRAGATPLLNFTDASFNIIEPINRNVTVPELVVSFETNEIDGQELLGSNEGVDGDEYLGLVKNTVGATSYVSTFFQTAMEQDAQTDAIKAAFDASSVGSYLVELSYLRQTLSGDTPTFVLAKGSGAILNFDLITDVGGDYYQVGIEDFTGAKSDTIVPDYDGPYSIIEKEGLILGPIKTNLECEEIWFDIIFRRGLKGNVNVDITTQELDGLDGNPIGPINTTSINFNEDTLDEKFFTHKEVLASKSFYQFTVARTNNSNQSASDPDATTLASVRFINRFSNRSFGNVTILEVAVPATANPANLRENKINLSLTSKLISYENGAVNYTPTASRRAADALLHMYVDFFGLDPNTLALDELYAIQNRLDAINPALATFDFTFDDIDVSLDERMDAILQVMRCYKWLDGDVYRFSRDESRDFESTLITRRDLASDQDRDYSLSYNPQLLEAFNGVKVQYVDTKTNKKAYIFRTYDPLSPDPNNPLIIEGAGSNPRTMELAGCQEEFNAINRAELEIRKLIYQRYTLTDTMLSSAMLLDKGDMVLYADQYNVNSNLFDGEIISIVGDVATASEHIDFVTGDSYQVHYTLSDGSQIGPFPISKVAGQPFKFQCSSLTQAYVKDSALGFDIQTGSRYIISTLAEIQASKWSVVDKEVSGRNIQVTMVNYDDKVFEFDTI